MLKEKPEESKLLADEINPNTYRTLMTRGQKEGFVSGSSMTTTSTGLLLLFFKTFSSKNTTSPRSAAQTSPTYLKAACPKI
jgi:hypothetical protein